MGRMNDRKTTDNRSEGTKGTKEQNLKEYRQQHQTQKESSETEHRKVIFRLGIINQLNIINLYENCFMLTVG